MVTMALLSVDFGGITLTNLTNVQIGFYGAGTVFLGVGGLGLLKKPQRARNLGNNEITC